MTQLSDTELLEYIREDIPYFDLTTHLLNVASQEVSLSIMTREKIVAACTEEAAKIAQLLGCHTLTFVPSGSTVLSGETLIEIQGSHENIHQAWRVCQIFLEHACGLASQAKTMLESAKEVNKYCEVFVTRKSFPFSKRFTIRALLCGGVLPHRLGLSETILVFGQHRALYGDKESFALAMKELKKHCIEKKLVIESETLEDAKEMMQLGADAIQVDKSTPDMLRELVAYRDKYFSHVTLVAAGGINLSNVTQYAKTGVNGIVTSALYQAKMADLTSKITSL